MAVLTYIFIVLSINLSFIEKVSAITITKDPNRDVVLNSQNPAGTSLLCQLPSSPAISTIYAMRILRKRVSDNAFSAIASVTLSDPRSPTIPNSAIDVSNRATVSLGIDTNTPTSSQLKLEFVTQQIVCTDVGEYKCTVTYGNANGVIVSDEDNTTLGVYALPCDITLEAKNISGNTIVGTADNPKELDVGDQVSFLCSAKIGSDRSTKIRWKITSETNASYIPYNPPTGTYSDGTDTGPSNCTYARAAYMNYNITTTDANRQYGLAFKCYVQVTTPTGEYTVPNPPTFHIKATDSIVQSTIGYRSTTPVLAKPTKPTLLWNKPCVNKCCIQGQKVVKLGQQSNPESGFLPGLTVIQGPTPNQGGGICSKPALIKVNFERISDEPCDFCLTNPYCWRRMLQIDLDLSYGPRNGFLFNIGDSVSNNGNREDNNDQQNDAETVGIFPHINVYTSNKCPNTRFLANINDSIGPNVNHVTIYVSNGFIRVTNDAGLDREVCGKKCLYALNGQTDTGSNGGINEDIYIALNRVVRARNDRYGVGVCSATFRWTCPWERQ